MKTSFGKLVTGSAVALALAFSLTLPSAANAQRGGRGGAAGQHLQSLQQRETNQIRQGMQNGSLTRMQGMDLANHMSQLHDSIAKDKASGNLTPKEATTLKNQTKKIEKAINGAETKNSATTTTSAPDHQ
jgi:hypothetical protein